MEKAKRQDVTCSVCGNTWAADEYDREVAAEFMGDIPDPGWCPSCGSDGDAQEVEQ